MRYIYFPLTAVFSQIQILEDGKMCETAMIGKEGFVNLKAIAGEQESAYWTEALVTGSVCRIESAFLKSHFSKSGILQQKIIEYAARYTEQVSQKVV